MLATIQTIVLYAIPVIFAITVHEVAHGWVADKLGDPTAKRLGRLTLNPVKHIDPLGTVILPGLMILLGSKFIFGWAKPVPITWQNLKHQRRDIALVAAAGPISNFIMALLWALIIKLIILFSSEQSSISQALVTMASAGILVNLILMVLNLIPIPPLDGSRIVSSFLSPKLSYYYNRIEPYGFFILIFLLFTGMLGKVMWPFIRSIMQFIVTLFGLN
ncbi:MAG: site-2 protease family protein [Legionellales bacterium]|nr:site-2 protease family protein [Legionellales bacterium]